MATPDYIANPQRIPDILGRQGKKLTDESSDADIDEAFGPSEAPKAHEAHEAHEAPPPPKKKRRGSTNPEAPPMDS